MFKAIFWNGIGFQKPHETPSSGRGAVSSGVHMALGLLTFLGEALHRIEAHEEMPKGIVAIKCIVVLRTMISWARR